MATICVFEDVEYKKLLPLAHTRAVYELKCGALTLLEKIESAYAKCEYVLHARDYLLGAMKKRHKTKLVNSINKATAVLFINGRVLVDTAFYKKVPINGEDEVFYSNGEIAAARLSKENLEAIKLKFKNSLSTADFEEIRDKVKISEIDAVFINYLWDLLKHNKTELSRDLESLAPRKSIKGKIHSSAVVYDKNNLVLEEGAEIGAMVVIDNRNGIVFVDKESKLLAFTRIEGPAYIGRGSIISDALIKPYTSIGPLCKVSGEVSATIIHGNSNKAHFGFIGDSYIGEWVNLGAGTTNSNLKNNYHTVKIWYNDQSIDTGESFVGCFIADHSKIGIGTLISTGAIIGVSANYFGGGYTPKFLPSFSWGCKDKLEEFRLDEAIKTAGAMMQRRRIDIDESDKQLLKYIYEFTNQEREEGFVQG